MVNPVFAYIDVSSGSLLAQLLLGGIAGLAAFTSLKWKSFRNRVTRRGQPQAEASEEKTAD